MLNRILRIAHDSLQHSTDFRGRKRALKWLLRRLNSVRSFYGPELTVRANDATFLASYYGRYGNELKDLIEGMPRDGIFLEFGANTGVFSLLAAKHLNFGMAIAVEPNPFVFRDLVENVRLNCVKNVHTFNFAVGDHTGTASFAFPTRHTGTGHIGEIETGERSCNILLLDSHQFVHLLPDLRRRHCLCKIDTEGAELAILRALERANILERITTFYIEIDEANLSRFDATASQIYDLLATRDYLPSTGRRGHIHYDEIFTRA